MEFWIFRNLVFFSFNFETFFDAYNIWFQVETLALCSFEFWRSWKLVSFVTSAYRSVKFRNHKVWEKSLQISEPSSSSLNITRMWTHIFERVQNILRDSLCNSLLIKIQYSRHIGMLQFVRIIISAIKYSASLWTHYIFHYDLSIIFTIYSHMIISSFSRNAILLRNSIHDLGTKRTIIND